MLNLKVEDILKATGGQLLSGESGAEINNISTDSRRIKDGDFFIPLIGDTFDAHDFLPKIAETNACGFLTSKDIDINTSQIAIKVEDTLKALQDIAQYHRERFNIPIIGITGSSGKTSTKDLIYNVLSKKYKVLKTDANFNNHIGVPLTLLNLEDKHEAAIIEMGMSNIGEISILSKISKPHIAVITNVGLAHIGNLGSRQNILKAKMEIVDGMDDDGIIVLNGDDQMLWKLRNELKYNITYFGMNDSVDLRGYDFKVDDNLCTTFMINIKEGEYKVIVPVPGFYNVYNALAAITIGLKFRVPIEEIIQAIKEYKPEKMRMNVIKLSKNIKLINDTYNANPNSMEEALKVVKGIQGARKIAVLGDMLELGEWTMQAHMDIGKSVVKNEINRLITLGENSKYIAQGAAQNGMSQRKINTCKTIEEANNCLSNIVREGDVILIKGSRAMKMEVIVQYIDGVIKSCQSK